MYASAGFTAAGQASWCKSSSSYIQHMDCFHKEVGAFPQKEEMSILNLPTQPLSSAMTAQYHHTLSLKVLSTNSGSLKSLKLICMADGEGQEKTQPHKAWLADSAPWGSKASCKQTGLFSFCYGIKTSAGSLMLLITHNSHTVFIIYFWLFFFPYQRAAINKEPFQSYAFEKARVQRHKPWLVHCLRSSVQYFSTVQESLECVPGMASHQLLLRGTRTQRGAVKQQEELG